MKIKNKAFTLAETLVVMGIIGVIAALTIPNLSQSTGNKEKVTKVKKAYAQLSEAVGRATAIYGPTDTWFTSDMSADDNASRFAGRIIEFMKISKDCKLATSGCFFSGDVYDDQTSRYTIISADGTSMSLFIAKSDNTTYLGDRTLPQFVINIDGTKKKTTVAKNGFGFYVDPDDYTTVRPCGYQYSDNLTKILSSSKDSTVATYWIIEYDNMDYLKVGSDNKCPSGKVLNLTANPPVSSCN